MTKAKARDPYAAFLRTLRQTPRTWRVTSRGHIRQQDRLRSCPLEAVATVRLIALPERFTEHGEVIRAADHRPGHDPRLRARLLRACGIVER